MLCPKRFAFKSSLQAHTRGHQNGTGGLDIEEDDIDPLKEQVKLQDKTGPGSQESEIEEGEEEENGVMSPSISPPALPQFGATIKQFNSPGLNSSPEADISKLTDSRQTVAMLQ